MTRLLRLTMLITLATLGSQQPLASYAQSSTTVSTPAAPAERAEDLAALQTRMDESIEASQEEESVLRAQLEEAKAANETMLSVVQWTVGLVLGALIVLLGYNVVQQRWADDRTRRSMTEDIRNELRQYLEAERQAIKSELSNDLIESVGETLAAMKTELKSLSDNSDKAVASLKRDYQLMNLTLLEESVRQSLQYGPFVSLHEALRLLELSLELEGDTPIQDPHVVGALESLRAILPRAFMITERDINDIGSTLDKVPEKYAASRESMRALVKVRGPEPPPPPPNDPQSRTLNLPPGTSPQTRLLNPRS